MVLAAETKIVQSKSAHTQYLIIPSVMVQDSQYPFQDGEEVRIMIDPYRKLIMVISVDTPRIEVLSDGFIIRGKKVKLVKG